MKRRTLGWIAACSAAALFLQAAPALADPPSHAEAWGYHSHDWDDRDPGRHDRDCDHRYYPRQGYVVTRLPSGYRVVQYRGDRYFYHRDVWYRPYGRHYVVVAPPMHRYVEHRDLRRFARDAAPYAR
jgi:hypothetical protein